MKKMLLTLAIGAVSFVGFSALSATDAEARSYYRVQTVYYNPADGRYYDSNMRRLPPVYRPNKYTRVRHMQAPRRMVGKRPVRLKKQHSYYRGGNYVPNPPRASVKVYNGPVQRSVRR